MTLNIVFLVDTSASMAGRKIEQLNEFMAEAVVLAERIAFDKGINIPIRVIEFNSEAKWLFGDADKGSGHIDWIPLHVDKNGHTDIVKAIHTAMSIMHKRILGERDDRHVVVLVSDGLGDDRQKSIEAIENLKHSLKEKIMRIAVRVEGANEEELITFASKGIVERDDGAVCYDCPFVIGANEHKVFGWLLCSSIEDVHPAVMPVWQEENGEPVITVIGGYVDEDDWED